MPTQSLENRSMLMVISLSNIKNVRFTKVLIFLYFCFTSSVSATLPTGQLSNVPWRRTGVKYTNNEAYFDVVEEVDAIIDKAGSTVFAEIQGYVRFSTGFLFVIIRLDSFIVSTYEYSLSSSRISYGLLICTISTRQNRCLIILIGENFLMRISFSMFEV